MLPFHTWLKKEIGELESVFVIFPKWFEVASLVLACEKEFVLFMIKTLNERAGEVFDCLYKVPDSKLISNPLSATSFFDENHIYNKFTIPQIDFTKETITGTTNINII